MEKFILRFLISSIAIVLASCQGPSLEPILGIDSNIIVRGSFTQYDAASIEGTGAIRFDSGATNNRHALTFKASLNDALTNSTVSTYFYSSSASLADTNGIVITFRRQGASVIGNVSVGGTSYTINSNKLVYYYPTSLDLIIEVHNTNPARILIWRRDVGIYTADTADVDSKRSGDLNGTVGANGPGTFVGMSLTQGTITSAKSTVPQVL